MLHSALCTHPLLRHLLRGVPGPNKWRHLPLNKLDDATVSARKLFLESYLQALLQRVEINSSAIMREFLGYDVVSSSTSSNGSSSSSMAFTGKSIGVGLPCLDKFWGRTVSGVFQTLRATLPIAEGEICPDKIDSMTNSRTMLPSPGGSSNTAHSTTIAEGNNPNNLTTTTTTTTQEHGGSPLTTTTTPSSPTLPRSVSPNDKYELQLAITAELQVRVCDYDTFYDA